MIRFGRQRPEWLFMLPLLMPGVMAACSGGGSGSDSGVVAAVDGDWTGTWSSSKPAPAGTLTLQLDQHGTDITGTGTFVGHPCFAECNVACQLNGEEVSGWFDAGPFRMSFNAFCSGPHHGGGPHHDDTMAGSYEILGGPCAGELGTIELTRAAAVVVGCETDSQSASGMRVGEVILIRDDGGLVRLPLIEAR